MVVVGRRMDRMALVALVVQSEVVDTATWRVDLAEDVSREMRDP